MAILDRRRLAINMVLLLLCLLCAAGVLRAMAARSFQRVVAEGDLVAIDRMIAEGARLDEAPYRETALDIAVRMGNHAAMAHLIAAGARPVDAYESFTVKPTLFVAIDKGDLEAVTMLLKAGADPECRFRGVKAVDYAGQVGATEVEATLKAAAQRTQKRATLNGSP
jgi:hypothetical protein